MIAVGQWAVGFSILVLYGFILCFALKELQESLLSIHVTPAFAELVSNLMHVYASWKVASATCKGVVSWVIPMCLLWANNMELFQDLSLFGGLQEGFC